MFSKNMFYCNELPFGIIPANRLLNIETMNIVSFYYEDEIALLEDVCEKTPKHFYLSLAIKLLEQSRRNGNICFLIT